MLNKGIQTEKVPRCIIPFTWYIHSSQIHRERKQIKGYQWMGERGIGSEEGLLNGYRVFLYGDENVLKLEGAAVCITRGIH